MNITLGFGDPAARVVFSLCTPEGGPDERLLRSEVATGEYIDCRRSIVVRSWASSFPMGKSFTAVVKGSLGSEF